MADTTTPASVSTAAPPTVATDLANAAHSNDNASSSTQSAAKSSSNDNTTPHDMSVTTERISTRTPTSANSERLEKAKETVEKMADKVIHFMKGLAHDGNSIMDAKQLGIIYITPSVLVMPPPSAEITHLGRQIDNVSAYLHARHSGRYMVVNLSEQEYDYNKFENQVISFNFPGYPAPPLALIYNINNAIYGWLKADVQNCVVVHCQTGRGRSATAVACYLLWCKQAANAPQVLSHLAKKYKCSIEKLLMPTQRRYIDYVQFIAEGRLPSTRPIKLERILMSGIPRMDSEGGCRPYLQVFKDATLLFTSTGRDAQLNKIRRYKQEDNSILFPVGLVMDGDILIRVRHYGGKGGASGNSSTIFRLGFHTGFCKAGLARYPKSELDGASDDPDVRFEDDFFLDLIFSPVTSETTSSATPAPAGAAGVDQTDGDQHSSATSVESSSAAAAEKVHAANAAALAEANYWQRLTKFNPPTAVTGAAESDDGKGFAASVFTLGDDSDEDEEAEDDDEDGDDHKANSESKTNNNTSSKDNKSDDVKSVSKSTTPNRAPTPVVDGKSAGKDSGKPSKVKSPDDATTAEPPKQKISMFAALGAKLQSVLQSPRANSPREDQNSDSASSKDTPTAAAAAKGDQRKVSASPDPSPKASSSSSASASTSTTAAASSTELTSAAPAKSSSMSRFTSSAAETVANLLNKASAAASTATAKKPADNATGAATASTSTATKSSSTPSSSSTTTGIPKPSGKESPSPTTTSSTSKTAPSAASAKLAAKLASSSAVVAAATKGTTPSPTPAAPKASSSKPSTVATKDNAKPATPVKSKTPAPAAAAASSVSDELDDLEAYMSGLSTTTTPARTSTTASAASAALSSADDGLFDELERELNSLSAPSPAPAKPAGAAAAKAVTKSRKVSEDDAALLAALKDELESTPSSKNPAADDDEVVEFSAP